MKKFLALFLALIMVLGVFASCGKKDEASSDVTLEQAKEYLDEIMKSKNGKETPNDYDVVGKIIIDQVSFDVTWKTDNESIKITESSKENMWTVDLPDVNETAVDYKLTATIKAADETTIDSEFTLKLPVYNKAGIKTNLEEGVAYKIFFKQMDLEGHTYYALNTTQDNANKFINATLDPKAGANFFVEIVDGGYKVYTTINDAKNYIHATATPKTSGEGYTKTIGFATETETVFKYDSELSTYYVEMEGEKFGVGTYGDYKTISISEWKYFKADSINVKGGQFPIGFMTAEHAETLEADSHKHAYVDGKCTCGEVDPNHTHAYKDYKCTVCGAIDPNRPAGNYAPVLNPTSLNITGNSYQDGKENIEGVEFEYFQLYHKDAGIQWRTKDDKKSSLWNNTTTPLAIAKIEITLFEGKDGYTNENALKIEFGAAKDSLTYSTYMSTEAGTATYTITPNAETYKFFKITHNFNKTIYIDNIKIVYVDAGHTHAFTEGKCSCGAIDPNHTCNYVNGKCSICNAIDPNHEHDYVDGKCTICNGEDPDYVVPTVNTIADALTAAVGSNAVLTGIVVDPSAWNTQYEDMNFTLKDESSDATIYVYACKTQVAVGDKITVTGTVGEHNNAKQIGKGSTAVMVAAHGTTTENPHDYTDGTCTICGDVDPNAMTPHDEHTDTNSDYKCDVELCPELVLPEKDTVLTIKEACDIAKLYERGPAYTPNTYKITGTISEIKKADKGNFIITDGTNTIEVYNNSAYTQELKVGDTVTLSGKVGKYSSTPQISDASGNDRVAIITHTPHTCDYENEICKLCGTLDPAHTCDGKLSEATCKAAATCSVCEKTSGDKAEHDYVEGTCKWCGHEEGAAEEILPGNLDFDGIANNATNGADYMEGWTATGTIGKAYANYFGFGRSGSNDLSLKSSEIKVTKEFTVTAVIKGNGSSGEMTSTLTFTLVDASGNTIATSPAITPVDGQDTTYEISFTLEEGKSWTDVSNLVITFAKETGNIGLKSLDFVQE